MSLTVRAWPTPDVFLTHLGAIDEVAGCVLHGLAHTWLARPESFRPGTPLLTVEKDGEVVAAAIRASHGKIVFSLGSAEAILALARWCDDAGQRPSAMVAPESSLPALLARWPGRRTLETTLYRLDRPPQIPDTGGHLRSAGKSEIGFFTDWIATFTVEARLPPDPKPRALVEAKIAAGHLFVWEVSGVPVAIAALAGPTPRSVRLNTVYTPPEFRRRGTARQRWRRSRGSSSAKERESSRCSPIAPCRTPTGCTPRSASSRSPTSPISRSSRLRPSRRSRRSPDRGSRGRGRSRPARPSKAARSATPSPSPAARRCSSTARARGSAG